jgi:hypothetical protein
MNDFSSVFNFFRVAALKKMNSPENDGAGESDDGGRVARMGLTIAQAHWRVSRGSSRSAVRGAEREELRGRGVRGSRMEDGGGVTSAVFIEIRFLLRFAAGFL